MKRLLWLALLLPVVAFGQTKISALPSGTTLLGGTESIPMVQSATTVKEPVSAIGTWFAAQISGDCVVNGSYVITCSKVNGASIPASAGCVGTNSSSQFISASCSGSGPTLQTNGTNNSSQTTLNLVGTGGVSVTNPSGGTVDIGPVTEPVTQETGTSYTVDSTWCGTHRVFTSASAVAVSLPEISGCQIDFSAQGAGTVTITPSAGNINGSSSAVAVAQNRQCTLNYDATDTNWGAIGCTALVTGGSGSSNLQTFTSNGTWTKPASGNTVTVECIAGGSGGGSGAVEPSGTAASGGGGGGGNALATEIFSYSSLPSTVTVTIGAAGNGGAAVAATGAGNAGTQGGNTTFGTYLTAYAGGPGGGGVSGASSNGGGSSGLASAGAGSGISAGSVCGANGNTGGYGGAAGCPNGGSGGGGSSITGAGGGGSAFIGSSGAGAGGWIPATPASNGSGGGGAISGIATPGSASGCGAGAVGGTPSGQQGGQGGQGSGSCITGNALAGGNGGGYGAPGGGGGAAENGVGSSGAGGNGSGGACWVITQ